MKISDLYEYDMGIQSKGSNQKVDEPENDQPGDDQQNQQADNKNNQQDAEAQQDFEKALKRGAVKIGGQLGQKLMPGPLVKGIEKLGQGRKPGGAESNELGKLIGAVTKAMSNPALAGKLGQVMKQAQAEGIDESTLAKRILKKLSSKKPITKFRKRSKLLKEADPRLFEINFNRKEIAREGLDAPVRCGFEAETFFYNVEERSNSDDVDNMSVSDVEYEHGDLPDSAYSDYNDWIMEKAMDEYLPDYIDNWIEENRDEDEFVQDFMNSGNGPTEEGVEQYREEFKEQDPTEYENREEDGWDFDNWARDLINEEYEADYEDFLRDIANEEDQLRDDAVNECEGDYSMDDWISDQYSSMSSFLDDYGYEYYSGSSSVEGVADELHIWQKENSRFKNFPETGDYGGTSGSEDEWAVETDSTIDPNEGAGAELISPVYDSIREMLGEMKSLFDWSEENFGTNNSTGLHITMSWQGEKSEPNRLKMALLLGDQYLLNMFGRLRNSYTKSQYRTLLNYVEEINQGDMSNFEKLQKTLEKGVSGDKYSSINFKNQNDSTSGNQLIEFRIAGGNDYNEMYKQVVQACVRYGTIMKAGYDEDAFRKDYIQAVSRLLRKSKEIDPKTAKEFDEIDSPVVDSAKEIVGKKFYFDVLKSLETSLRYFQEFENFSDPKADAEWKQSIKDFKKGTGKDPSWMGEAINEEEITGYIEPDSMPPSKRAKESLEKAQKYFGKAMAILARNIASGTSVRLPKAKNIADFRKYAGQLKLDVADLETVLLQSIDDANYNFGSEKEDVKMLQTGVKALFKKDIVGDAEYFNPQDFDPIADGLWQFFQHDDFGDNKTTDKLAQLIMDVNQKLEKDEILAVLDQLKQKRQKNELYRYLKDSGYGVDHTLFRNGMVSDRKAIDELKAFLQNYNEYEHPTSRSHHSNIKSDDRYESVYQMNMIQKMRTRLQHLSTMDADDEKTQKIKTDLMDLGIAYVEALRPDEDIGKEENDDGTYKYPNTSDGEDYLASDNRLESWNNRLDRLVKVKDEIPDGSSTTYNFVPSFDDGVLDSITLQKYFYRKDNYGIPKHEELKKLIKQRFAATKKFLTGFDKIFQGQGFANMAKEIKGKNTLDRRNKDFEKNVRDANKAKFNIPGHAWVYINKRWFEDMTSDEESFDRNVKEFDDPKSSEKVFIIPAAHWSQADDAYNGLDLIKTFEKADNYYHTWRKTGYNKILNKFYRVHSIPFQDLAYNDNDTYVKAGGDEYSKLQKGGVEITRKGDSRAGSPGQDYLIDPENLQNPTSGEPIDRGSAMMWNQMDDEEKEMKRFKAFDFSVYPEPMKGLVAKELKGMKEKEGYYSFQNAISNVLDKINSGKIDLALNRKNNVDGMIQAAGVEDYKNASSSEVADNTNWSNLTDYLKIERGVNDQGVNLLKRVYDNFDSDHNWRPEDPRAIGTERWAAAVKAAYEYIKDGYNVSGGNYFRKNQDGSDGDDVSSLYGGGTSRDDDSGFDVTTDDYESVRRKYFNFNTMMMNGIQNYILQPDVNRLVGFLKNEQNDEDFKKAVLVSMMREREAGEEPNDFQGHLARGRMYLQRQQERNNESVFDKFDALPLQEQLRIINESDVLEKWSQKYKKSINCSNPKGFSQKAHCAGKKKKTETKEAPKGTYFTKTGNLVKGRLTKAAKERGARETDPKDKSRSKVPPVTQTRESDYDFGGPRIDKDNTWRKFLRYKYKFKSAGSSISDMERIIRKKSPKEFSDLMNLKDRFYAGDQDLKTEGKRIPRKKGQPAGSKKHSDLYTDENPKGTIHGLKFATVKDAQASVSKIRGSGKKHAHKIQAAVAMEQRAKAAGKKSAAAVYRKFINQMKKKTKKMKESRHMGSCFESSVKRMLELIQVDSGQKDNLKLAHGIVTGTGGNVKGKKYGHAWLEMKDALVIDTEQNVTLPKDRYYQIGNIDSSKVKLYDFQEVSQWLQKSGTYGPWELDMPKDEKELQNENYGKYYCSTDKKWKYRKGPKQSRKTNERKLSTKEKNKKEKYVMGMKKSKGDFEKRYGKDAKAVMYATATKMAKENINTNMSDILERFENLSLDKQLEIIRNDKISESLADLEFAKQKRAKRDKENTPERHKENTIQSFMKRFNISREAAEKRVFMMLQRNPNYFDKTVNERKLKIESLQATEILVKAKKLSESLPNHNKIDVINDILSKEFPVGDLDIQFKAYMALPIPKMMNDFSKLHSAQGYNADGRDIVRHFAKNRMPEEEVKKLKLNENIDTKCPRTRAKDCSCESVNKLSEAKETVKALCELEHTEDNVKGIIYLKQESGMPTKIYGNISGLTPGKHGFHIHEYGDLSKGCESAGAHYDPDGVDHGDIDKGHVGDLGNVVADEDGVAKFKIFAHRVDLSGDRSVVGRAMVIHEDEDDLGKGGDEESLKTGNAGARLGCGVIRLMNLDEQALAEDPRDDARGSSAFDDETQTRMFYKRDEMPQLKQKHLDDPKVQDFIEKEMGEPLQTKRGTIGLDKIQPMQLDRVPGLSDSAKKFFAQGKEVQPFIIDRNGKLINGHHRYDAAKSLGIKRVPFIAINFTIHEMVRLFGPKGKYNLASKGGKTSVKGFARLTPVDDPKLKQYQDELEKKVNTPYSNRSKAQTDRRRREKGFDSPAQQQLDLQFDTQEE